MKHKIKHFFWWQLTKLGDRIEGPEWLLDIIDWFRYEVFYPYD